MARTDEGAHVAAGLTPMTTEPKTPAIEPNVVSIDANRPHEEGLAQCAACLNEWVAVAPVDRAAGGFECQRCGKMEGYYACEPFKCGRPEKHFVGAAADDAWHRTRGGFQFGESGTPTNDWLIGWYAARELQGELQSRAPERAAIRSVGDRPANASLEGAETVTADQQGQPSADEASRASSPESAPTETPTCEQCAVEVRDGVDIPPLSGFLARSIHRMVSTAAAEIVILAGKEQDALRTALTRAEEERDAEEARWQQAIYERVRRHVPLPDYIDGSGCDSGDPLDLTLSEITQGFIQIMDERDEARSDLRKYEAVIHVAARERNEHDATIAAIQSTLREREEQLKAAQDVIAAGVEARRRLDEWRRLCVSRDCESYRELFVNYERIRAEVEELRRAKG